MIVFDSDAMVLFATGHQQLNKRLNAATEIVVTTVITRIELVRGRFDFLLKASDGAQLQRAQHWLTQTERDLRRFVILPIDDVAGVN